MRKLDVIPIIHTNADMGSIGQALSEESSIALGEEIWRKNKEIVAGFWESIARFFNNTDIKATKIYQDGMVGDGVVGLTIVNEGVRQGSVNYQIIAGLLRKGAILIKTEDIALVKREYSYIKKLTSAKSTRERETAALKYKLAQHQLLEARDSFIARTIASTLKEGDIGILFIGAYHEVLSKLPVDIHIVQIKEVTKVKEYHRILSNISAKTQVQYQQLAEYLVSPVLYTGTD